MSLKEILLEQGLSLRDVLEEIQAARILVMEGESPEDVLLDMFGLEGDYVLELVP